MGQFACQTHVGSNFYVCPKPKQESTCGLSGVTNRHIIRKCVSIQRSLVLSNRPPVVPLSDVMVLVAGLGSVLALGVPSMSLSLQNFEIVNSLQIDRPLANVSNESVTDG